MRFARSVFVIGPWLQRHRWHFSQPPESAARPHRLLPPARRQAAVARRQYRRLRLGHRRGLDPGDMDPSAPPCGDFYQYCGRRVAQEEPDSSGLPELGAFNELDERNREIAASDPGEACRRAPAARGSEERKLGDFYASCMDEAAIEAAGISPLQGSSTESQLSATGRRSRRRSPASRKRGVSALFQFGSEEDRKNSSQVIAAALRAVSGFPTATTTRRPTTSRRTPRRNTSTHVAKMLELAGETPAERRGAGEDDPRLRDEARGAGDDARRAAQSGQYLPSLTAARSWRG